MLLGILSQVKILAKSTKALWNWGLFCFI